MTNSAVIGMWGAGREGLSVCRYLDRRGVSVVLVDESARERPAGLPDSIDFRSGDGALDALADCAEVVISPGVPRVHPFRAALDDRGVSTTSATNLWMRDHTNDVIGVTGTKGKSTTSSLIHFLLTAGTVESQLAGNIGVPLTDLPDTDTVTVVEMSSYQCAFLARSPRVAVVTSLFQDHLPWHGSLRQYWLDKANVFARGAEVLVCNADTLEKFTELGVALPETVLLATDDVLAGIDVAELPTPLRATHNRENLALAILAARQIPGFTLSDADIAQALASFEALPHRLATISTFADRRWVDDTLATTTESVIAALSAFPTENVVLLAGGLERGIDYSALQELLARRTPNIRVVCLPDNGVDIVGPYRTDHPDLVHTATDLSDAVRIALEVSEPGTVVLLSPGAPSYNVYRDFEEKSEDFRRAVDALG